MNYDDILAGIAAELRGVEDPGKVATYIPELANVDANRLGMYLATVGGAHHAFGDADEVFSIQSIAKVLSLTLALKHCDEAVWKRVGVEPSGTPYNSLVQLERERGQPRNPLINAGAIVICDMLVSCLPDPKTALLDFIRLLASDDTIDFMPRVAESERQTGYRNYALANLMKGFGNLENDIDTVMDLYFHLCSIGMSCGQLARTFLFLANDGLHPGTGEEVIGIQRTKRINSVMQLCGFYDEAGEFTFRVGLPGKSGVGGGIVAVLPGVYSIAVWSPRLNEKGNSWKGMRALESFTTRTQTSIF